MAKKVLILSKNLQAGGAERQLVYLAIILSELYDVSFSVYEKKGVFIDELECKGIPIITFQQKGFWRSSREFRRFIKQNCFDTVISYLPECNLINELSTLPHKSWRIIVGARSANPEFVTNPRLRFYYYAHLLADVVISNSESNKKDILKVNRLLSSKKVHVVYNMFQHNECKSKYIPFRGNKINIVVAANYRTVKNLDGVLRGLSLLSVEQREKIHIDWYGMEIDDSLSEGEKYIRSYNLDDVIALHPSVDSVSEEYNKTDVVGLFSHYEGLPNSLCEALVQGKMVICTPVSDMPLLLDNTKNIVLKSSSSEDIKIGFEQLIKVSRDSILSIGQDNAEQYASMFEMMNIKQQLLRIIQK